MEILKRVQDDTSEKWMPGILFIDQVGYFLSPFDFLRELLTFFLFRVAFNRFVLFLRFMSLSF
jgi:hypothetical protein